MSKYLVLFHGDNITEKDMNGTLRLHVPQGMVYGYPDPKDGWTFDSPQAAHIEAKANDYVPGKDYIVVRVIGGTK